MEIRVDDGLIPDRHIINHDMLAHPCSALASLLRTSYPDIKRVDIYVNVTALTPAELLAVEHPADEALKHVDLVLCTKNVLPLLEYDYTFRLHKGDLLAMTDREEVELGAMIRGTLYGLAAGKGWTPDVQISHEDDDPDEAVWIVRFRRDVVNSQIPDE